MAISTIQEAIDDIRGGKMIILVDDEDRENEGDLCVAAQFVSPETINFMARYGRGLICLSLSEEMADKLKLQPMVQDNKARFGTAFTISIEARNGVTTGISAADRATTIKTAVNPEAKPEDLVSPGHVFPIRARKGGVLVRTGQTEGSVDLCRLAGLTPAGVICEVMRDDGTMARMPDLEVFAREYGLKIVTIADLIDYRMQNESLIRRVAQATIPTCYGGDFNIIVYENDVDQMQQNFIRLIDLTLDQSNVLHLVNVIFVNDNIEIATMACRDCCLGHPSDKRFILHPVINKIGNGNYLQAVFTGKNFQIRHPRHCAVISHDLTNHTGRCQTGQTA